jgi:hypothetical protein
MFQCLGYAAASSRAPFGPITFERREPGLSDIRIEIQYCGVCHSCVPGHEIVGHLEAVGGRASKFKPGDVVGVGVLVDSCRECRNCRDASARAAIPLEAIPTISWWIRISSFAFPKGWIPRQPPPIVCGRHDLFAAAALEGGAGPEGWRRRSRMPWPCRCQDRGRARGPSRRSHHFAGRGGGRSSPRRHRSRDVEARHGDGGASQQLRFHPRYCVGQTRHQPIATVAASRRHVDAGRGFPSNRSRSRRETWSANAALSPGRLLADSPRRRKCSISAPRTGSRPTSRSSRSP